MLIFMGYNFFCEYIYFPRIYSAGEKYLVLLKAHTGIFQGYTVSFENIAKERHTFKATRNVENC